MKVPSRHAIPRPAIYRLSVYLRCLISLKFSGLRTISSEALAQAARVKSTQLRKDLTYIGQVGTRGLGYDIEQLADMIASFLGTDSLHQVILVGVGNLGRALLAYRGFEQEGFEITAAFDVDPAAATALAQMPVLPLADLPKFVHKQPIRMAILTVPSGAAQEVAGILVRAGISGILNFAPVLLQVPEGVVVNNVNLAIELENLSYFVKLSENAAAPRPRPPHAKRFQNS